MNMFKYLLLSMLCGSITMINAQEVPAAATESAGLDAVKTPVVVPAQEKQPETKAKDEKGLAEGQDIDFEEWAKSMEMTDEEKAQFLAEMNELNSESQADQQQAAQVADKADESQAVEANKDVLPVA